MRWFFTLLIGLSAFFIAGCAAVFSVKGLGLLFAGSMVAVMTMAASLEAGKLVAAAFLYRHWRDLNNPLRLYLLLAVFVLMGITSLGIYGYLARAYQTTHTKVALLESRITSLDQQVTDVHQQIQAQRGRMGTTTTIDSKSLDARQQRIVEVDRQIENSLARLGQRRATAQTKLDHDLELQNQRTVRSAQIMEAGIEAEQASIAQLSERIAALDRAVDAYTAEGVAGLFKADHVKMGQELRQEQRAQREVIGHEIKTHQAAIRQHRATHAAKTQAINDKTEALRSSFDTAFTALDNEEQILRKQHSDEIVAANLQMKELRAVGTSSVSDRQKRIDALYQQVRSHEGQATDLRERIAATDVGTYRFVARAMGLPVDHVVRWLILVIVLVFDPLAVALTIGFNVALMNSGRQRRPVARGADAAGADRTDVRANTGLRIRPWATALAMLLLIAALGAGGYSVTRYVQDTGGRAYARMIPADCFAVVTLHPYELQAASTIDAAIPLGDLLPTEIVARLKQLAVDGFALDRPTYLFAKYPQDPAPAEQDHPVLLIGLVAPVDDPARAEAGLATFAESVAGVLWPRPAANVSHSRTMVDYGTGRYLDPEGGFFSYALADHVAVIMLEIEGDPESPLVEHEIRRCLVERTDTSASGESNATLPNGATAAKGAISVWFDGQHCFERMPKNAAARNRHEMLRRYLDFEAVISIHPIDANTLRVVGDYRYRAKRFDPQLRKAPDAIATLAELGPAPDAQTAGLLMDRCADTLEFDSMITRLRQRLGALSTGTPSPQIVVDKFIDSETNARFELIVVYDARVDSPLAASAASLEDALR